MSAKGHRPTGGRESGLRSHRVLLAAVAAALLLGWLAWNVLLVESDVATVAEGERAATGAGR
ncbi:hypothetical protein KGQ64_04440 [bacterium]|nr:hypothetical protein [bacterium]